MHGFRASGARMSICRACRQLSDRAAVDGLRQRCACDRGLEPTWPGYDYNERVHLCRLCHAELLRSGSRFSVWFCPPCKELVVGFNDRMRRWLIPTGRHSFMVRVYEDPPTPLALAGPVAVRAREGDLGSKREVDRFITGVLGMGSTIDRLFAWSERRLDRLFEELGFPDGHDVDVSEFQRRLLQASARDARFGREGLFRSLTASVLERALGSEQGRTPGSPGGGG